MKALALRNEQLAHAMRSEAEARAARLNEAQQVVARLTSARDQAVEVAQRSEGEIATLRSRLDEDLTAQRSTLQSQIDKLQAEMLQARKAQRDAAAQAQQARSERDEIKKLAAQRLQQVEQRLRESKDPGSATAAPRAAPLSGAIPAPTMPPPSAAPTVARPPTQMPNAAAPRAQPQRPRPDEAKTAVIDSERLNAVMRTDDTT